MDIYKAKDSEEKRWAPTICTITVKDPALTGLQSMLAALICFDQ